MRPKDYSSIEEIITDVRGILKIIKDLVVEFPAKFCPPVMCDGQ